jgi:hypothetical protein
MRRYTKDRDNDIVKDGERVTVPMMFMDSAQRAVRHYYDTQRVIDAKLRDHGRYVAHRPHCCADALSNRMWDSLNHSLADAIKARDAAFRDLEERSRNAWRRPFADQPASLNSLPPENEDQKRPPRDDDDGDNNDDDRIDLNEAMRQRDAARDAQYDRQLWRSPPSIYSNTPVGNISQNGGRLDPRRADEPERLRRATVLR